MGIPRTDRVILERLGRRIAAARARSHMTQVALAERAGIEPVTLSRWETGARSPSVCGLVRLAEALRVQPGELLDEEPPPTNGRSDELVALAATLTDDRLDLAVRILRELGRNGG